MNMTVNSAKGNHVAFAANDGKIRPIRPAVEIPSGTRTTKAIALSFKIRYAVLALPTFIFGLITEAS